MSASGFVFEISNLVIRWSLAFGLVCRLRLHLHQHQHHWAFRAISIPGIVFVFCFHVVWSGICRFVLFWMPLWIEFLGALLLAQQK